MFTLSFNSSKFINLFLLILCFSNSCFSQSSGWILQRFQPGDSLLSINFVNSQTGWACGKNNLILKTTNGGNDWIQQVTGFNTILENIYFPSIQKRYRYICRMGIWTTTPREHLFYLWLTLEYLFSFF